MPLLQEFQLTDNVALVTGGDSPLGRVICLALAEAGADVAVAAYNRPDAEEIAREVRALGRRALGLSLDVLSETSAKGAAQHVINELGQLDILVNAEQQVWGKPLILTTTSDFRYLLDVNVVGLLNTCQAVGPHMMERGRGRIINLSSALAIRGLVNATAYCAASAAIVGFTQALALEWAAQGVTVNAIGPGWFAGGPVDAEQELSDSLLARMIPAQRRGTPEDIAGAVVYLASEGASFVSAQTLYLEGGMLSHP